MTRPMHPTSPMGTMARAIAMAMALLPVVLSAAVPAHAQGSDDGTTIAFRVGKVITMDDEERVINNAVVLVQNGRIAQVGRARAVEIPAGSRVIEQPQAWLVPGLVELHNHTAGALGDLNDLVYLANPGLRSLETVVPESPNVKRARAGGVTTALLIPGSGTNITGFGTIVKFSGPTVDDMVVQSPGSLKVAQAGNPERYWFGVGRTMMNYNTRRTLEGAKAYHDAWVRFESGESAERPRFNPIYEDFRGLFTWDMIASVHTQQYQVVMTTVDMLANRLGLFTVLDHSTFDAWKTAPLVLEAGHVMTICGPRAFYLDPTQRRFNGIAARWWQGGVRDLGINTDAPVIPQEELTYQAAMGVYYGWKPYEALKGITRIGARALRIESRVGSIEVGKDADFGLWTGDPIDPRSQCLMTVIDGRVHYDAAVQRVF